MKKEEAIKILRETHDSALFSVRTALETLIPELAESEDERIRKNCIHFLEYQKSHHADTREIEECISWLEKQKEQKPAEWSEEDKDMLNSCISSIEEAKENRYAYKETDGDTSYDHEIAWLKSLRPQSKDEIYNEEDKAYKLGKHHLAIKFMNYLDENRPEGKMSLLIGECEDIDEAFKKGDWAKIMRYYEKYRPSWKPSEEQMDVMREAVVYFGDSWVSKKQHLLESLYNDLKKLTNESTR